MSNTGGPAFPTGTGGNTPYSNGMTLRDYFAAKAMMSCRFIVRPYDTNAEAALLRHSTQRIRYDLQQFRNTKRTQYAR